MRIILPWEKPILQQFMWKNVYVVYCQSLVSNPARLSILTAYEIDPGYRTSVVWAIFVSLAKRVPRTSLPPWKRKADDILSAVKDSNVKYIISAHYILYGWNVILPPGVSQMWAFLLGVEITLKRPQFLDISAHLSLLFGWESRHFEIFSCSPLTQVQTRLSSLNQCATN